MKTRTSITIAKKLKIIEEVSNGRRKVDVAREYKISPGTLSCILKNKEAFMLKEQSCENLKVRKMRRCKSELLNSAVLQFFKNTRAAKIPVSGIMLKEKAKLYAEKMSISNFAASDGWLSKFKKRHNISFKKICGESADVSQECVNDWLKQLPVLIKDYELRDIFNFDETGLFYQCLPDKTFEFKSTKCFGGKHSKVRITLVVGANCDGSEKLPLLVIGKSKKPRCFKSVKTLPVIYKANKKAWMTSLIFEEYLQLLDESFLKQNRRVLIFVDNCPSHPKSVISNLKAIKLVFFPVNMTSKVQPMDLGIIKNTKCHYRKKIVMKILKDIDEGTDLKKISLLDAIIEVTDAWNNVTAKTITNCFRKAGFQPYWSDEDDLPLSSFSSSGSSNELHSIVLIPDDSSDAPETGFQEQWQRLQAILGMSESFEEYVDVDVDLAVESFENDDQILATVNDENGINTGEANYEDNGVSTCISVDGSVVGGTERESHPSGMITTDEAVEPLSRPMITTDEAIKTIYTKFRTSDNVPLEAFNELYKIESFLKTIK